MNPDEPDDPHMPESQSKVEIFQDIIFEFCSAKIVKLKGQLKCKQNWTNFSELDKNSRKVYKVVLMKMLNF